MRFLILTDPGDPADDPAMARYHDDLVRAGVLLAGDLTAGFWLLEVDSRAEAAEWGRRVPHEEVEIREIRERSDGAGAVWTDEHGGPSRGTSQGSPRAGGKTAS